MSEDKMGLAVSKNKLTSDVLLQMDTPVLAVEKKNYIHQLCY